MPISDERGFTESQKEAIKLVSISTGMDESDVINAVQHVIDELNKEAEALNKAIESIRDNEPLDLDKWTYRPDKKERKKEKLPKKSMNGWSQNVR